MSTTDLIAAADDTTLTPGAPAHTPAAASTTGASPRTDATSRPDAAPDLQRARRHPLLGAIGNTPLLELTRIGELPAGVRLFAKAEFMNPGGSIKDRAAAAMVLDGIERGALHLPVPDPQSPGLARPAQDAGHQNAANEDAAELPTIIDATSGNTGIALAMIGAALGIPVTLVMPENTSPERKGTIRHLGATVIDTVPAEDGSDGAFETVREIVARDPHRYFYPDQYGNPANARAHEAGTGAEIWRQTRGRVSHFVASMGTSGTLMGTSRRLKRENPEIHSIAVQPDSPLHGIEGTKHMGSTIRPSLLDDALIDDVVPVSTEQAYRLTRELARHEGLLCGISSGANVAAALQVARSAHPGDVVVTVLPDTGARYLSDGFWEGR